jgi:putative redox protein
MKVTLKKANDGFHFEGKGESEVVVNIDASEKMGGKNLGARPMELLLMGIGSCGAMDIVSILKKQREDLKDLSINVEGKRDYAQTPAIFTEITIMFTFYGNLDTSKVEKAVSLSMEKYCSVSAMLEHSAKIQYSYEIVSMN